MQNLLIITGVTLTKGEKHQPRFTVFTAVSGPDNDQRLVASTDESQFRRHLTLLMTSAQVVETSVKVITNSPSQDYTQPDDHTSPTYELQECVFVSSEFKTDCICLFYPQLVPITSIFFSCGDHKFEEK